MSILADPRWEPLLTTLAPELEGFLAHASGAIASLLGPVRERSQEHGGEVDGYSGLTRRGPYERLLLSEWLLAEVAPEEFLRRASSSELAFHAIARHEPASRRAVLAVLDAGPEQLGAPRVGQLAAMIALDRRAQKMGSTLVWTIAGEHVVRTHADADALRGFLRAHTDRMPDAAALEAAITRARPHGPFAETFVVGGAAVRTAAQGARVTHVRIDEPFSLGDDRALRFEVARRDRPTREARVALPSDAVLVRLLRRPFENTPAPTPSARSPRTSQNERAFDLRRGLALSPSGSHLLGLSPYGEAVAHGTGGVAMDGKRTWHVVTPPDGARIVALGYERKTMVVVTERGEKLDAIVRRLVYTFSPSQPLRFEERIAPVLRFGMAAEVSLLVPVPTGTLRLDATPRRHECVLREDLRFGALLKDAPKSPPSRDAHDPSLTVTRKGTTLLVQLHVDPPVDREVVALAEVDDRAALHVAVDPGRTLSGVAVRRTGSPVVQLCELDIRALPVRRHDVEVNDAALLGVVWTRAGFALVLLTPTSEVVLAYPGGRRVTAFRPERGVVEIALAHAGPVAAIAERGGLITVFDLDMGRVLCTARGESA